MFSDIDFQQLAHITGEEVQLIGQHAKADKIPEYWLKVFLNSDVMAEQVQERDEPLLKYLQKLETIKYNSGGGEGMVKD